MVSHGVLLKAMKFWNGIHIFSSYFASVPTIFDCVEHHTLNSLIFTKHNFDD